MDVALACSGTVTTELASQGAAVIVGYKLGWVTWALARAFLMRSRYITLLTSPPAAGRARFVQTRLTPANLSAAANACCPSQRSARSADRASGSAEADGWPGQASGRDRCGSDLKLA
jgi:lipid-A-disaccharide synthase